MAVLNSIRKRGFFLILIIALALFAFVLDGLINKKTSGGGDVQNVVAAINGEEITREDFMTQVENYQRSLGPSASQSLAMNQVWDRELRTILYKQQAEKLGLSVGEEEINDQLRLTLSNNPTFQDENGFYSEAKVVEYVASIKGNPALKQEWNNFIEGLREGLIQQKYVNLVRSGMITTLAEGEQQYRFENDKVNIEYVQVPYSKIADEDVPVTDAEIEKYIREHADEFEVDPMVDIEYVSFEESPSIEDIDNARAEMEGLVTPFENAEDVELFITDNSDVANNDRWLAAEDFPEVLKDTLLTLPQGKVFGPYKDGETFKISKVTASIQMPDSVEARHILIRPGLSPVDSITRSTAQARSFADSLLTVLKADKSKFATFVEKYSTDTGSVEKGGHYDYFGYNTMVAPFRDFCFEGKVGDLGVVETQFGFHIIEVEGQKGIHPAYKIATVTKEIEPSESTLSMVFSESAKFEEAARDNDFAKAAEDKGLTPKPVNRIGKLDATIPGIGNNRTIINWAFQDETSVGDVKRFNINDSYVVARLTRKSDTKALMSVSEASATVTPILRKQKKAKKIREGISGATLQEIASSQNVTVKTASALTRSNPTIAGAGTEPVVVGRAFGVGEGQTTELIDGETGVFVVRVLAVTKAPDLENYAPYANQMSSSAANTLSKSVFDALKNAADIEDNRADFY